MDSRVRKTLKYVLPFVLAAALLYFSFRGVDWKQFWKAIKLCRWGYVGLSMAIGLMAIIFRGLRWRELLRPLDPQVKGVVCYDATAISYVVNMVLPRVGELVRCGYITSASAKDESGRRVTKYEKVLGTMVVDRLWDMLSLVLLFVAAFLFAGSRYKSFFSSSLDSASGRFQDDTILIMLSGLAAVVLFIFLAYHFRGRSKVAEKIAHVCDGIWQGIGSCLRMKSWWKFIVYTVLIWLCYWGMSWSIVLSVQAIDTTALGGETGDFIARLASLDSGDAFFLLLAGSISSIVPVPGGFGAFHYVVAQALNVAYGIPRNIGIIFATLSHESQAVMQLVAGALAALHESYLQALARRA